MHSLYKLNSWLKVHIVHFMLAMPKYPSTHKERKIAFTFAKLGIKLYWYVINNFTAS